MVNWRLGIGLGGRSGSLIARFDDSFDLQFRPQFDDRFAIDFGDLSTQGIDFPKSNFGIFDRFGESQASIQPGDTSLAEAIFVVGSQGLIRVARWFHAFECNPGQGAGHADDHMRKKAIFHGRSFSSVAGIGDYPLSNRSDRSVSGIVIRKWSDRRTSMGRALASLVDLSRAPMSCQRNFHRAECELRVARFEGGEGFSQVERTGRIDDRRRSSSWEIGDQRGLMTKRSPVSSPCRWRLPLRGTSVRTYSTTASSGWILTSM